MKESFTYYKSFAEGLKEVDDHTYRRLSDAIVNYALYDEEPDLNGLEMTVFQAWKANVDASNRRKENGRSGGRPKEKTIGYEDKTIGYEDKTIGYDTDNHRLHDVKPNKTVTVTETLTKTETKNRDRRFTPPTPDEVRDYVREKNYNVDADKFCDFYESKGWMIGKNKMKDWKASVRTWARSQRQEVTANGKNTNKFNNFEQSDTDWDAVADMVIEAQEKNR